MSNVLIEKNKLDLLANAIAGKSGEPLTLTLDEMVEAVDGIDTSGITPSGNINITQVGVTDVTNYATATVYEISPLKADIGIQRSYITQSGQRKWEVNPVFQNTGDDGAMVPGYAMYSGDTITFNAIPIGTTITPSTSSQTIGGANYMMEGAVTVSAMPSGTAGTPTATKGTVSNHSISVTPSVTNTTGYITGSTKTGTAVTVSASELVSGSETKTENGTYDVTNLAEIVVDVQGGGGSTINVGKTTKTLSTASSSIQFTGLSGNPTSFVITSSANLGSGVTSVVFDGSSLHGQVFSTQATADTGFTKSYSSGTLTVTSSNSTFGANEYKLAYTYGGSASDIQTADVQVGSGATSITFPTSGRPIYWSCIFKSDFSTSSGYQRVMEVANDGTNTYGISLDSTAHASATYWTANYSGGNLVISSQSTNAGGYFHQPGYYQLTYAVDSSAPLYESVSKTYRASTSAQSEKIEPSTGYDAMSEVNISIPAVTQTNLVAGNIKSGTTISISNGSTNLWSVTGTYTGGGSSTCATTTMTNSNDQATSIEFTGLSGQPKWFFVRCTAQMSRSSSYSYYYVTAVRYNGTNHYGNYWRRSNGTFYNDTTHYSHTYSNGTLTVSSSANRGAAGGSFYSGTYELVYIY